MKKKYKLGKTKCIYVPEVIAEDLITFTRYIDKYDTEYRAKEIIHQLIKLMETFDSSGESTLVD